MIAPEEQYEDANTINGSLNEDNFIASSVRPRDGVSLKTPGRPSKHDDCKIEDVESETGSIIMHVKPASLESSCINAPASIDQHDDWDIEKTPSHSDQTEDPKCSSSCDENERTKSKSANNVDQVDGGSNSVQHSPVQESSFDDADDIESQFSEGLLACPSTMNLGSLKKSKLEDPKLRFVDGQHGMEEDGQYNMEEDGQYNMEEDGQHDIEEDSQHSMEGDATMTYLPSPVGVVNAQGYFSMFVPNGEVTDLQRRTQHLFFQAPRDSNEEDEDDDESNERVMTNYGAYFNPPWQYDDTFEPELMPIFIQHVPRFSNLETIPEEDEDIDEDDESV
eukprot:gene14001-15459_t